MTKTVNKILEVKKVDKIFTKLVKMSQDVLSLLEKSSPDIESEILLGLIETSKVSMSPTGLA
jgi:hypothetical protein